MGFVDPYFFIVWLIDVQPTLTTLTLTKIKKMKKSWEKALHALLLCPQLLASPDEIKVIKNHHSLNRLNVWLAATRLSKFLIVPCQIENLTQKSSSWKLAIQSKNITRARQNVSLFAFTFSQETCLCAGAPCMACWHCFSFWAPSEASRVLCSRLFNWRHVIKIASPLCRQSQKPLRASLGKRKHFDLVSTCL